MMRNKPGRPSGAGRGKTRKDPADWDDRPVKAYARGRGTPGEYSFADEDEFSHAKNPARARANPPRPAKRREAVLPFGDDGYPLRPKAARPNPYEASAARKAVKYAGRPARKTRYGEEPPARRPAFEDYPMRAARGYDEELPVRGKPGAHLPRPVERRMRPGREGFEEYGRPVRRAGNRIRKKKPARGALLCWAVAVVLALLVGFGVRTFGFELIAVRGDAMRGTLSEGEIALVKKTVYYTQKPARGDIVAVSSPEGKIIRRVVALPGETIEIRGGIPYVNGEPLSEPYVYQAGEGDYPLTTIQEGCYFVMCDNRLNIDDSRTFGLIRNTRSLIVGKVESIVWPPSEWGSVA